MRWWLAGLSLALVGLYLAVGCEGEVAVKRLSQAAGAVDLGQGAGDLEIDAVTLLDGTGSDGAVDSYTTSCGAVPAQGCCDGETLWWCKDGALKSESCAGKPKCGWNSSGFYDCNTSGSPDPTGTVPFYCTELFGDGGPPPTDLGSDATGGPCGSITFVGCCDGDRLRFCDHGVLKTIRCSLNPSCGWYPMGGFYDCGSSGGVDPTGTYPKVCPGSSPVDGSLSLDGPDGDAQGADGGDGGTEQSGCSCDLEDANRTDLSLSWCLGLLATAMIAIVIRRRPRRPCA
jgi:hypothetical protein